MEIMITVGGIVLSTIVGSIVYRVREMETESALKADKEDVKELIETKLESHSILLEDVRRDVERLIDKLDRFLFAGPRE